jgi:hypothetical protein
VTLSLFILRISQESDPKKKAKALKGSTLSFPILREQLAKPIFMLRFKINTKLKTLGEFFKTKNLLSLVSVKQPIQISAISGRNTVLVR